jgi:hypothetical protein
MAVASFIAKALLPVVADMLIDRFKDQRDDLLPRNSLVTALGKLNKIGIFSEVAEAIGGNSKLSIDDLDGYDLPDASDSNLKDPLKQGVSRHRDVAFCAFRGGLKHSVF